MKCYSAMKNEETLPFATWMDLESIMLREINHTEKDRYWSLCCGILKKKTPKFREKGSDLWVPEAEVGGGELEKSDQKA